MPLCKQKTHSSLVGIIATRDKLHMYGVASLSEIFKWKSLISMEHQGFKSSLMNSRLSTNDSFFHLYVHTCFNHQLQTETHLHEDINI